MPLYPGKENVGRNIRTEIEHGKPRKQAIAIAMSVSRKSSMGQIARDRVRRMRRVK